MFLGLALGDALGVPVEFKSREALKKNPVKSMLGYGTYNQKEGTWSDDSSLTFCLAESLLNGYNLKDIYKVIKNCDLAITACGISALDLICSRVPSIYVSNENKELQTAKIFGKLNLGIYYGKITIKNQNMLRYHLNNLLKNSKKRLEIYKSMKKLSFKNSKHNLLTLVK